MNPCIAIFLDVDTKNGFDVDAASRRVFLCSDTEGQRKFLQNKKEQVGCVFVNGNAPDGSLAFALPCNLKNFEHLGNAVLKN